MSEHEEQATFFDFVRLNRERAPNQHVRNAMKLCYSNQTGAHMKISQAGKMKAEGMTKGVLDVNLDWPAAIEKDNMSEFPQKVMVFSALRIEHKWHSSISDKIQAKIDTGNYFVDLSLEQREFRELLIEAGYKVVVSYSAVQSIRAVFEYLPFEVEDYAGIREFLTEDNMADKTAETIIREYLIKYDYDGLRGEECGCEIDELFLCEDFGGLACVPGHKIPCDKSHAGCDNACRWHIAPGKNKSGKAPGGKLTIKTWPNKPTGCLCGFPPKEENFKIAWIEGKPAYLDVSCSCGYHRQIDVEGGVRKVEVE